MSEFICEVVRVKIEAHPNADAIEIARIGDYQSIVRKGQVKDGDLAVYIPEQAVVPEWLLREMDMYDDERKKGGLAGSLGNRVKAIKLRGIVSQGLVFPLYPLSPGDVDPEDGSYDGQLGFYSRHTTDWDEECHEWCTPAEGDNVAEYLGITKYEPKLPSYMSARVVGAFFGSTHKYDFDNLKKMPNMFTDGEEIVITEKIHGTLMMVGVVPEKDANESFYKGRVIISSKGMGAKGFVLDHNDEGSVYAQAARKHNLLERLYQLAETADNAGVPIFILGEVFGKTGSGAGIQDLTYTGEEVDFRAFDMCVGNRGSEKYAAYIDFRELCELAEIPTVPELYVGPYSKDMVLAYTDGPTTLGGAHIREGVVVKSLHEERNPHYGRKIAKSISNAYLLRKNSTEYN